MSDACNSRDFTHAHQALELSVGSEEVVAAAGDIRNNQPSIGEDRHAARRTELARTFTRSAQLSHEPPVQAHHKHLLSSHERVEQHEVPARWNATLLMYPNCSQSSPAMVPSR